MADTFKEQIADDLDIFINDLEFADEHNLNGTACKAVVQSPTSEERFISGMRYNSYDGIYGRHIIVHCRTEDLPEIPVEGQRFDLDGETLLVASCVDDMGMLSIELEGEAIR